MSFTEVLRVVALLVRVGAVSLGLVTMRRLGGAVSWGLLITASSKRRRVIGIADQSVVWVAPCRWDC